MALADGSVWETLGIDPTDDAGLIRRAYAKRLRAVHPEDDAKGFGILRLAYENALQLVLNTQLSSLDDAVRPPRVDLAVSRSAVSPDLTAGPKARPPFPDSMTIDQMLDELALDERREPELERLRRALALDLRPGGTASQRTAALERIFRSEAMKSSRLYAATEAWLAILLLRGASPETEPLLDPCIAFFSWDDSTSTHRSPYREPALLRRDALALRQAVNDPAHRLHKAYLALQRPLLDSYTFQYGMTFGLRPRVAELMLSVNRSREFERLLDPDAVRWWRKELAGVGYGPARFWGMILVPPVVAKLASFAIEPDHRGLAFVMVWLLALCGYLLAMAVVLAIVARVRNDTSPSIAWIADLDEAAP